MLCEYGMLLLSVNEQLDCVVKGSAVVGRANVMPHPIVQLSVGGPRSDHLLAEQTVDQQELNSSILNGQQEASVLVKSAGKAADQLKPANRVCLEPHASRKLVPWAERFQSGT
jgi:hypothetical protein